MNRPDLVETSAAIIAETFGSYVDAFRALTRQARIRFEAGDWLGVQRDAAHRFDLYTDAVGDGLARLRPLLGPRGRDRPTWTAIRGAYARRVASGDDSEQAETFFNSFTRKIFDTIGVDPAVEFVAPSAEAAPVVDDAVTRRFVRGGSLASLALEV